jgi:hypothetical protein
MSGISLTSAQALQGALFFSFPRGNTAVTGGVGRSDAICFGGAVSFFGFLSILLLR